MHKAVLTSALQESRRAINSSLKPRLREKLKREPGVHCTLDTLHWRGVYKDDMMKTGK